MLTGLNLHYTEHIGLPLPPYEQWLTARWGTARVCVYVHVVELHRTMAQKHRIMEYHPTISQPVNLEKFDTELKGPITFCVTTGHADVNPLARQ